MPDDDAQQGGSGGDESPRTLTQEQVDKIVEERLARERKKFADYDELRAKADKLAQIEDDAKSEGEKLSGRLADAEKRAVEAEKRALRLEVALDKGLNKTQAKRLVGDTEEELASDADELLASFRPPGDDDSTPGEGGDTTRKGRPTERLTPGAAPSAEPEKDTDDLVDAVVSRRGY